MEQLKQHMWLAAALAMSLPLSAAADGNNADGNRPNPTLESVQRALLNRIDTLQTALEGKIAALDEKVALQADVNTLKAVAAKRGVAVLQVVPRNTVRSSYHYYSPRYFVMGSTIKGFHDTVAFGTEIIQASTNHTLPAGSYMFELQQPRPPDDDARCAIPQPFRGFPNINRVINSPLHSVYEDAMIYEPAFGSTGSTTATSGTSTTPSFGFRCRVMRIHSGGIRKFDSGAAVLKFDGTQGFEVVHRMPTSWTTGRSVSSYYGSVRITKLE